MNETEKENIKSVINYTLNMLKHHIENSKKYGELSKYFDDDFLVSMNYISAFHNAKLINDEEAESYEKQAYEYLNETLPRNDHE